MNTSSQFAIMSSKPKESSDGGERVGVELAENLNRKRTRRSLLPVMRSYQVKHLVAPVRPVLVPCSKRRTTLCSCDESLLCLQRYIPTRKFHDAASI